MGLHQIGRLYVPTKYGGALSINSHLETAEIYYIGQQDVTPALLEDVYNGAYPALAKAPGNLTYEVPKDKHGWYYYRLVDSFATAVVTNSFTQSKTVDKAPWPCEWFPMAESLGPSLYDPKRGLKKFGDFFSTDPIGSTSEKWPWYTNHLSGYQFDTGHYIAQSPAVESNAEVTWGADINRANGIELGVHIDFCDNAGNIDTPDGDTDDSYSTAWYGHCDTATIAIMLEEEPKGPSTVYRPGGMGETFTAEDKMDLLVALYHDLGNMWKTGPDPEPYQWHERLEEYILEKNSMFAVDLYNFDTGPDLVWNYPVYGIKEMTYKEKAGGDEHTVDVECTVHYWQTNNKSAAEQYYKYSVTYNENGVVVEDSNLIEWYGGIAPDELWYPDIIPNYLSLRWVTHLDAAAIRQIVNAPVDQP